MAFEFLPLLFLMRMILPAGSSPFWLYEVYARGSPACNTRITVPVLWDTKTNTIISNDSWSIMKILATTFRRLGAATVSSDIVPELYPAHAVDEIEGMQSSLYHSLLNGVYRAGIPLMREGATLAYTSAAAEVKRTLEHLDKELASRKYMVGNMFTLLDIRLLMCLIRYDAAYLDGFGLRAATCTAVVGTGSSHPHLRNYVRSNYYLVKQAIDWPSFRQYFRWAVGLSPSDTLPDMKGIVADITMLQLESPL